MTNLRRLPAFLKGTDIPLIFCLWAAFAVSTALAGMFGTRYIFGGGGLLCGLVAFFRIWRLAREGNSAASAASLFSWVVSGSLWLSAACHDF